MASYNWGPGFPSTDDPNFETLARADLSYVKSAGILLDTEVQTARGGEVDLNTRINAVSLSSSLWVSISNASRTTSTTFTITGTDASADFPYGTPIRCTVTGGFSYGYTSAAPNYSGGNTILTVDFTIDASVTAFVRSAAAARHIPKSSGDVSNNIVDVNNKIVLSFSPTTSAVNYLQIKNSATTGAVELSSQGSDTNIELKLIGKGTGVVRIGATSSYFEPDGDAVIGGNLTSAGTASASSLLLSNRIFTGGETGSEGGVGSITALDSTGGFNPLLVLKSSAMTPHGVTTLVETDTFGTLNRVNSTEGGVEILGLSTSIIGMKISAVGATDNNISAITSSSRIVLVGYTKSGTGVTSLGASTALFSLVNNTTGVFTVTGAGYSYFDSAFLTNRIYTGGETTSEGGAGSATLMGTSTSNPLIVLKAPSVSHSNLTIDGIGYETDTFFSVVGESVDGGVRIAGIAYDNAIATQIYGIAHTYDQTSTGASTAVVITNSGVINGSGMSAIDSTGNIFGIRNNGTLKFLVKGNGNIYSTNTSITAFDDEDDMALIESLKNWTGGQNYKTFVTQEQHRKLEELSIISGDFLNIQNMMSLTFGGMVQMSKQTGTRFEKMAFAIASLGARLGMSQEEINQLTA